MTTVDRVIQRVRHEMRSRMLEVKSVEKLTPNMVRVTLTGSDLEGFVSAGFDDHMKVFFPAPGELRPVMATRGPDGPVYPEGVPKPAMRDFTPRRYDAAAQTLLVDFAMHEAGPAATWASQAQPGQFLGIGGPRGSFIIPMNFDWHLLVGDETALPAIGRRLEELPAGSHAVVVAEVNDAAEELSLTSAAKVDVIWAHRNGATAGTTDVLAQALRKLQFPKGDFYAWVACETTTAKRLREQLLNEHGASKQWIKAAGYWKRGAVAVHDTHTDAE